MISLALTTNHSPDELSRARARTDRKLFNMERKLDGDNEKAKILALSQYGRCTTCIGPIYRRIDTLAMAHFNPRTMWFVSYPILCLKTIEWER
jgi:hypothetical protein